MRIVAVPPRSKLALVRSERVKPGELAVRAVVMLRDLMVSDAARATASPAARDEPAPGAATVARPARSAGRAVLAINGAALGGFVGYSVQRASGSDDPRLLYPLMALGTGFGVGASMIVAEEWDVGVGDAWYLSAAAWWPAASGLLIAAGRDVQPVTDRWSWGLVGATAGLGLGTTSLALGGPMSEGGALLTHSGAALGLTLGGLTELAIDGSTEAPTPYRGLGWGAAAGVVLAGTTARFATVSPARVLSADIGAALGGLGGAALTSPFLFGHRSDARDRVFLGTTAAATVAGGITGFVLGGRASSGAAENGAPWAGPMGVSQGPRGEAVPAFGVGWRGVW